MPRYRDLGEAKSRGYAPRAIDRLLALREQLREEVPQRTLRDTLLLATWNIRDFDSNKFKQGPRLRESFHYIAEVIAAFDLVAVQEVNADLGPLEQVMDILGPAWHYIATDVTEGRSGNRERMAFVYDSRKVRFRNVAGEIVLPLSRTIGGQAADISLPRSHEIEFTEDSKLNLPDGSAISVEKGRTLELPVGAHVVHLPRGQKITRYRQFARTPFLVAFEAGWFKFNLCTVHLYFGDESGPKYQRRVEEIDRIAGFIAERAEEIRQCFNTGGNFILLGDFNIVGSDDPTMKALEKHGFEMPAGLCITNVRKTRPYDQIAFLRAEDQLRTGPSPTNSGVFEFFQSVFRSRGNDYQIYHDLMRNKKLRDYHDKGSKKGQPRSGAQKRAYYRNQWRTWQMSDHYPLWVELKIDFSDEYLHRLAKDVSGT